MKCVLDKISISYELVGEGQPVLMLHGWPLDHRYIASNLEPIFRPRQGWKRIYLDLPGMGETPGADWIQNQDHMLQVVLDFVDAVIPGERFVVVGESYGGHLARGLVHQRADQLDGLFLYIPMIVADREKRALPSHVTLVKVPTIIEQLAPDEQEIFDGMVVVQSQVALDKLRAVIQPAVKAADHEFLTRLDPHREFSFDVDKLPQPFLKPTLILLGRQDSVVGYRDAWEIIENYPRATLVVLDCAGHFLGGGEQVELFGALVNEWLDRVEAKP